MLKNSFMLAVLLVSIIMLAACGTSTPEFYPISVSTEDVKAVYEPRGYSFSEDQDIFEQPQIIGLSPSGLTIIQMVGPPENLYTLRITSRYNPPHSSSELENIQDDMESIFTIVSSRWRDGKDWFVTNIMEFTRSGTRRTSYDGIGVALRFIAEKDGAHGVSFGAWEGIAEPSDDGWDTSE